MNDETRLDAVLDELARQWSSSSQFLEIEKAEDDADGARRRWLLRFKGEEKDVIALWLTLRQRSLEVEAEIAPAPDEQHLEVYRFVLRRNAGLAPLHVALGPEEGLYLVGRFAADDVTAATLDEICGAAVHYVDELFPTIMSLGYPKLFRRRRR